MSDPPNSNNPPADERLAAPIDSDLLNSPEAIQARLAAIVESSEDAIISKTLKGIITTWNKGAQHIFGYTAEEIIGRPINTLIPADRQSEEPQILRRIHAGERVDHFETIRQTKDGRLINISVTISPIRDGSGRIIGASKVARDITLQKRIEEELHAAKEAAELANHAKDRFLSILSHELRTPLTPVLAAISMIEQSGSPESEELREQISMIRRNVETEARLVDDLLDVTRIARGKVLLQFEAVDLHAILRNVVTMLQGEIDEKRLSLTLEFRAAKHHVWGDAGRLQQVFLNLLSNAVKFTLEGGSITLRSMQQGERVRVQVIDTGIGIDAETLPRLFDAFEQGEHTIVRRYGGLGLGLSIARSLAKLHEGEVSAFSEGTGKGSTFIVELVAMVPSKASDAPSLTPDRPARSLRILLVEDHSDTRQVMGKVLGSFGHVVYTAGSVREALEIADREKFDLLVSDIGLPDGSGIEVMQHMRARHAVRGIALSGFGQDEDLRRSREAGFDTHLTKPINFQTLRDVLFNVISRTHPN